MQPFFTVILIGFILLTGCTAAANIDNNSNNNIIFENGLEMDVFFCPRDNCTLVINEFINTAKNSVHCAFFDLDLTDLIKSIAKKSHEADVKIVIDKNNYESQIKGPGIKIAYSKQYMHNKFCIIDNKKILTGSFNPTFNGANLNNNNIIIINSNYISENYEDEFIELWNGIYSTGNNVKYNKIGYDSGNIENYFCPEDNCKKNLIKSLNQASESIYFMTFSFTDEDIADMILYKDVDVKGIFEKTQAGSQYSQFNRMKDFGLDVKKDKNKKNMHHKVFIIDNETVITGSYNPSKSGNTKNDENMLIIQDKDIALKFLEEFEMLWDFE